MTLSDYIDLVMTYVEKNMFTMEIVNGGTFVEPYLGATWALSAHDFTITTPSGAVVNKHLVCDPHNLSDIGMISSWIAYVVNNPKLVQSYHSFQRELDAFAQANPKLVEEGLEEHESRKYAKAED